MEIEGTPRIIVWGISQDATYMKPALTMIQEQFGAFNIVGLTSETELAAKNIPFIPLTELSGNGGGYDILLVVGGKGKLSSVVKRAKEFNLDTDKILADWIVCIPGFTFEKYRRLQRSKLSIFSMNCFGGKISNFLGLPFLSPIINLFMEEEEYIRFLQKPREYMEKELVLQRTEYQPVLKFDYPIFAMDDVFLHMNHYPDFDEAVRKWNERKARINWYNLFVTMYTESPEVLEKFDRLPYGKKVCFVPFKSDMDSAFYVNLKMFEENFSLWQVVNAVALGNAPIYDLFDMLLYGKKTQLVDM